MKKNPLLAMISVAAFAWSSNHAEAAPKIPPLEPSKSIIDLCKEEGLEYDRPARRKLWDSLGLKELHGYYRGTYKQNVTLIQAYNDWKEQGSPALINLNQPETETPKAAVATVKKTEPAAVKSQVAAVKVEAPKQEAPKVETTKKIAPAAAEVVNKVALPKKDASPVEDKIRLDGYDFSAAELARIIKEKHDMMSKGVTRASVLAGPYEQVLNEAQGLRRDQVAEELRSKGFGDSVRQLDELFGASPSWEYFREQRKKEEEADAAAKAAAAKDAADLQKIADEKRAAMEEIEKAVEKKLKQAESAARAEAAAAKKRLADAKAVAEKKDAQEKERQKVLPKVETDQQTVDTAGSSQTFTKDKWFPLLAILGWCAAGIIIPLAIIYFVRRHSNKSEETEESLETKPNAAISSSRAKSALLDPKAHKTSQGPAKVTLAEQDAANDARASQRTKEDIIMLSAVESATEELQEANKENTQHEEQVRQSLQKAVEESDALVNNQQIEAAYRAKNGLVLEPLKAAQIEALFRDENLTIKALTEKFKGKGSTEFFGKGFPTSANEYQGYRRASDLLIAIDQALSDKERDTKLLAITNSLSQLASGLMPGKKYSLRNWAMRWVLKVMPDYEEKLAKARQAQSKMPAPQKVEATYRGSKVEQDTGAIAQS